jgi:hypothetical protein
MNPLRSQSSDSESTVCMVTSDISHNGVCVNVHHEDSDKMSFCSSTQKKGYKSKHDEEHDELERGIILSLIKHQLAENNGETSEELNQMQTQTQAQTQTQTKAQKQTQTQKQTQSTNLKCKTKLILLSKRKISCIDTKSAPSRVFKSQLRLPTISKSAIRKYFDDNRRQIDSSAVGNNTKLFGYVESRQILGSLCEIWKFTWISIVSL